jgi:hypothetical protein
MGLTFTPEVPPEALERLQRFGLFNAGTRRSRRTVRLIQGERAGVDVTDVQHRFSSGESGSTWAVVFLSEPGLDLPVFSLRPHMPWDGIRKFGGWSDIDLEDFPAFSKGWALTGEDEQAIRLCFSPEVVLHFEKNTERWGITGWTLRVEGNGDGLIVSRLGGMQAQRLREHIDEAIKILYVFADRAKR